MRARCRKHGPTFAWLQRVVTCSHEGVLQLSAAKIISLETLPKTVAEPGTPFLVAFLQHTCPLSRSSRWLKMILYIYMYCVVHYWFACAKLERQRTRGQASPGVASPVLRAFACRFMELRVAGLDGNQLQCHCSGDMLGHQLLTLLQHQLPPRPGGVLSLWFGDAKVEPRRGLECSTWNSKRQRNQYIPSRRKTFNFKGSNGKTWFLGKFWKNKGFPGKILVFHLHPLFWHFSQAKCRMFEEQSKGAGSRAGVERSRQVSFTAKLYIGFLDVFWESLVVSFCTAKCAIAPCSSRLELKRQG